MLRITYRHNHQTRYADWTIHEEVPDIATFKVQEIEMSGPEADYVESMMGSMINKPTKYFFGDLARTIFLNLDRVEERG